MSAHARSGWIVFAGLCSACSSPDPDSRREDPLDLPSGPTLACEPGDYDLLRRTGDGLSLVVIEGVEISEPSSIFGEPAYDSKPFSLCIPEDAVSLALYADGGNAAVPSSWVGSGLGEVVDTTNVQTLVRAVTPDLSLPKSREVPLLPGRATFELLANEPLVPSTRIALRRGARHEQSSFRLNLVTVEGSGLDARDSETREQALARFEAIYGPVGVTISALGAGHIPDPNLAVLADVGVLSLVQAQVEELPSAPLLADAVDVYLVRELLTNDGSGGAGQLAGKAFATPGVPLLPGKSGVVLSVDAHRIGGATDPAALWTTAAHELGHWHGLRHTTERWGFPHDYLPDTPQCEAWHDTNFNDLLEPWECEDTGAENLMFWYYDLDEPPTALSPGQGWVLHAALTMEPG